MSTSGWVEAAAWGVCMCLPACASVCAGVYLRACLCAYISLVDMGLCTFMHVYVWARVNLSVCVREHVHAHMCLHVIMRMFLSVYGCLHLCTRVRVYTSEFVSTHTYVPRCIAGCTLATRRLRVESQVSKWPQM